MFLGEKEITGIYLGDIEMSGVYLGDKESWTSAEPFYWIKDNVVQEGFPSEYVVSTTGSNMMVMNKSLTSFHIYGNWGATGSASGTATVETKRNKYIEIQATVSGNGGLNSFMVAGVECKNKVASGETIIVDISDLEEVTISCNAFANKDQNHYYVNITSIRCY